MNYLRNFQHALTQNHVMKRLSLKGKLFFGSLMLVVLSFLLYQGYYFFKHQTVYSSLESSSSVNLKDFEQNEVLKEINELYTLEPNQQAVVGKITDVERLSSQHQFFKKAQNGNYLLVMPQFTLIYSRENKQVVDIARENLLDLKEAK